MLIYAAVQSGQYRVARAWATKIRSHQEELHTAAYGDGSRSWTHLPLVYVRAEPYNLVPCMAARTLAKSQDSSLT